MDLAEFDLIRSIIKQIPRPLRESAGLRDDAAVLNLPKSYRRLLTTDAIVENVDFRLRQARPEHIGRKALAINLSDIAAMGGTPDCFTIALGIPPYIDAAWIKRFYQGLLHWAKYFNVVCAGGDISKAACFFASVTVLGRIKGRPILRCGSKPGDWIGVTGTLGGSIQGHHFLFKPRIEEGRFLADKGVHAMMDVSDGLLQDLDSMMEQSLTGCDIEMSAIPISRAASRTRSGIRGKSAGLGAALSDGEDFELLFTASPKCREQIDASWHRYYPKTRLSWIGVVTEENKRVWRENGIVQKNFRMKTRGYQHFR